MLDGSKSAVIVGLVIGTGFLIMLSLTMYTTGASENEEFKLMLRRTTGDSDAPGYRVSVDETGWVTFEGHDNLAYPGKYHYPIEAVKVKELVNEIENTDFFSLKDEYGEYSDGTVWSRVTIVMDGNTKTVYNYDYDSAEDIFRFENRIDEILETKRWVYGEE